MHEWNCRPQTSLTAVLPCYRVTLAVRQKGGRTRTVLFCLTKRYSRRPAEQSDRQKCRKRFEGRCHLAPAAQPTVQSSTTPAAHRACGEVEGLRGGTAVASTLASPVFHQGRSPLTCQAATFCAPLAAASEARSPSSARPHLCSSSSMPLAPS